ncbi:hypothetical protein [Streptomyces laurentii]
MTEEELAAARAESREIMRRYEERQARDRTASAALEARRSGNV